MAWFGKTRKVLDEAQRDSREAQAQVDQTKAEMRARGLDVDRATQEFNTAMASGAASDIATMGQRAARLMTDGIEVPATVLTIVLGEQSMMTGNGVPVTIGLTVEPAMAVPYQAVAQQVMVADMARTAARGFVGDGEGRSRRSPVAHGVGRDRRHGIGIDGRVRINDVGVRRRSRRADSTSCSRCAPRARSPTLSSRRRRLASSPSDAAVPWPARSQGGPVRRGSHPGMEHREDLEPLVVG